MTATLATGAQAFALTADSPNCRGVPTSKCLCDTCNNLAATPCRSNADCVAAGATICGGKRCLLGANAGAPCASTSECPGGGLCGSPGEPTAPNQCDGGTCSPNPSDTDSTNEGVCAAGPAEQYCAIQSYRPCSTNADCPLPGDSCDPAWRLRECFTDNGTVGGTVSVAGVASTTAPTLGALMCVPPSAGSAVNAAYGFPGAARFTIPGTAVIN